MKEQRDKLKNTLNAIIKAKKAAQIIETLYGKYKVLSAQKESLSSEFEVLLSKKDNREMYKLLGELNYVDVVLKRIYDRKKAVKDDEQLRDIEKLYDDLKIRVEQLSKTSDAEEISELDFKLEIAADEVSQAKQSILSFINKHCDHIMYKENGNAECLYCGFTTTLLNEEVKEFVLEQLSSNDQIMRNVEDKETAIKCFEEVAYKSAYSPFDMESISEKQRFKFKTSKEKLEFTNYLNSVISYYNNDSEENIKRK